jgi:hypothetical protein
MIPSVPKVPNGIPEQRFQSAILEKFGLANGTMAMGHK